MMPDLSGIAYLAVIGMVASVIIILAAPIGVGWGLAWLLEPRAGPVIWTIWTGLSALWVFCLTIAVGTLFFSRH